MDAGRHAGRLLLILLLCEAGMVSCEHRGTPPPIAHHHPPFQPGTLRADLSPEQAVFACALKQTHDELKLATLVVGGATVLVVQGHLTPDEFRLRLAEAQAVYARGIAALHALRPLRRDGRKRAYLAAAQGGWRAISALLAAEAIGDRTERQQRMRAAADRLAKANRHMRTIGETFWQPEYVPAVSEGHFHTH